MKVFICVFTAFFGILNLHAKTITDMAGRQIEIPDKVERVLPYDPKTSILIFPVLKDKMVATSILPGKKNYKYISPNYAEMPEVDVKNIEAVLTFAPQVILYGIYNDNNDNTTAVLNLGRRLNIPVLMVDMSIGQLDKAYLFLGRIFSIEAKCQPLADYLQAVYTLTDSLKKSTPAIDAEAYYSLGPTGLMTDPAGSKHTEVLDYASIPNAARVDIPNGGHAKVNMEQVLMWNPAYIFTSSFKGNESAYTTILTDTKWSGIEAVQHGNVYKVPSQPLGWFDHPPSINRVPGIIWMNQIFYHYPEDKTERLITEFYRLFYGYDLTGAEYKLLFKPE